LGVRPSGRSSTWNSSTRNAGAAPSAQRADCLPTRHDGGAQPHVRLVCYCVIARSGSAASRAIRSLRRRTSCRSCPDACGELPLAEVIFSAHTHFAAALQLGSHCSWDPSEAQRCRGEGYAVLASRCVSKPSGSTPTGSTRQVAANPFESATHLFASAHSGGVHIVHVTTNTEMTACARVGCNSTARAEKYRCNARTFREGCSL